MNDTVSFTWQTLAPGLRLADLTGCISGGGSRWNLPSQGHIWLWLNYAGTGIIWGKHDRFVLKPDMFALTGGGGSPADDWACMRYPGSHQLQAILISPDWLKEHLGKSHLHPDMRTWLDSSCPVSFCGLMGVWENELFYTLRNLAGAENPSTLLAEAKILEWAAVRLFDSSSPQRPPAFCASFKDRSPVRKALSILAENLEEKLDLQDLARQIGIPPHYLSRKVRTETGLTLQRHRRRLRIEKACKLLSANPTETRETALSLGYNSFRNFTKSFHAEKGMSPADWLKTLGKSTIKAKKTGH